MALRMTHCLFRLSTQLQTSRTYSQAAKALVDNGIRDNKVFVISKVYCPFCLKAKAILKFAGLEASVVEIESRPDCSDIQDYCKELTGARSVPRVWVDQKLVGGADAVEKAYKDGTL